MPKTDHRSSAWHRSKCQDLVIEAYRIARRIREDAAIAKQSYRPDAIYGVPPMAIARELVKHPEFVHYSPGGMRMVLRYAFAITGLQEIALKTLAGEGDDIAQQMLELRGCASPS